MSRGNDARASRPEHSGRASQNTSGTAQRSSRSSVKMTAERARAIQSHADRTGTNQDFKSRAMAAAERNETDNELSDDKTE